MVNGKKAFFKTLEAIIALFIVLTFLTVFIPNQRTIENAAEPVGFLSQLRDDEQFRLCVSEKNATCINQTIDSNLNDNFEFTFNLSDSPSTTVTGLPSKRVFSESLFLVGNITNSSTTIVRVFYYSKG